MTKLIFGCGYLGLRIAELWRAEGKRVCAVTRSIDHAQSWRRLGIEPLIADVTTPASLADLPAAETVLYSVGFDRMAGKSMREVYVEGLRNVLDALPAPVRRIVSISSTSVYAQTDGGWVDEQSACEPTLENGRVCLEAERLLEAHPLGQRAIVLRLAGIYGPGRIPRRQALAAGEPIAAPREGWLNLIHVDDAARIVLAAERKIAPPRRFTVSDGQPSQRWEYYAELARLSGAPPPTFVAPQAGSPAALRAESNKRVSNRRLLSELNIKLEFPSYREGLASVVANAEA